MWIAKVATLVLSVFSVNMAVCQQQTVKVFPQTYATFQADNFQVSGPAGISDSAGQLAGNFGYMLCFGTQDVQLDSCYNRTLASALDVYTTAGADTKVAASLQPLEQQIASTQQNIKALADSHDALSSRLDTIEAKPNTQDQTIAALQQQLVDVQAQLKALSAANDALNARLSALPPQQKVSPAASDKQSTHKRWWSWLF